MKYQTLHSHTTNSDGELDLTSLIRVCSENNIGTVAITDHDSVLNEEQISYLHKKESEVNWISGIEISSGFPSEMGGGVASEFHILGLFVDPFNKNLVKHCKLAQEARVERMQKMVKNLTGLGFKITEEDCLAASGGETVGRPHIVKAILANEKTFLLSVEW